MIISAARALAGARTVFVGVGLPNIACNLARRTVAPELELVYEAGVCGARPDRLPLSIGDPALVTGAISVVPMADLFGLYLQGGRIEVALLGGAQIDRFGNLNTSVIGSYDSPKVRLPGSGGANEISIHAQRVLYIIRLTRRAFVEHLDFTTSPGHLGSGVTRRERGLPGAGPEQVITDRAIFDFDNAEREMQITSLHPDTTLGEIRAEIGWEIRQAGTITETPVPIPEELRLIREELDPGGTHR